jgi:hypothetical protein
LEIAGACILQIATVGLDLRGNFTRWDAAGRGRANRDRPVPTRLRHLARDLGTAALGGRSRQGFAYSGRSLPVCLPPTPQHRRERQRRIGPWRTSTFDQPYGRSGFHSNTRYPIPRFETSRGFCRSWEELAAAQGGFARGWALWQRTALLEVGRQEPKRVTQGSMTRSRAFRSPVASDIL